MALDDKRKWDKKYSEMPQLLEKRPPSDLVVSFFAKAPGNNALDLACGSGRHTLFLAKKGFHVDAVDISTVALDALRSQVNTDSVNIIEADLDTFTPQSETYDLIVKTNFLDRLLIERAKRALKPGGILIVETYMADPANEKPESNPDFLLRKGELLDLFGEGFDVLEYKEFRNEPHEKYRMRKQAIAVRKS
jgi:tellurite methyltransferase